MYHLLLCVSLSSMKHFSISYLFVLVCRTTTLLSWFALISIVYRPSRQLYLSERPRMNQTTDKLASSW